MKPGLIAGLALSVAAGLWITQSSTTLADPGDQSDTAPWHQLQLPAEAKRFVNPGVAEVLVLPSDSKAIPEVMRAVERRRAKVADDCPPSTQQSTAPSVQASLGTWRWGAGLNCLPGWSSDV